MIYLGEQLEAKNKYFEKVNCWINKKLKGSFSESNKTGYQCEIENCDICNKKLKMLDLNFFSKFILPHIPEIINAPPDEMLDLEKKIESKWVGKGLGNKATLKEQCKILFSKKGYTDWFTGYSINYNLAEWLNQHTCTFCNRQYIFVARKKNKKKGINCQFDHWYDKERHPLFALSFYNLIPCCSLCNSSVKSSNPFDTETHLHPYLDSNVSNQFTFSYMKKSTRENEIIIANENVLNEKTKRTLEDLGTKLVYKKHSGKELQDLIDLRYKYSRNYLNILLKETFKELKMTDQEIYRIVFGIEINEENYHKRIMSKFKKDIMDELLNTPYHIK